MASPDLDYAEYHISVRDGITQKPYVTSDGLTSLDIPYERASGVDSFYEPTKHNLSTATVTLPSLIDRPDLRSLFQNFKDGNRVEIFDFQPDCGDPMFAGFIPPNGITEQDGKVTLNVVSSLGLTQWRRLRRQEYLSTNAAGLYDRCLSQWTDLIADDFSNLAFSTADFGSISGGGSLAPAWLQGAFSQGTSNGVNSNCWLFAQYLTTPNGFAIQPGDTFLLDADFTFSTTFGANAYLNGSLTLWKSNITSLSDPRVSGFIVYQPSGVTAFPQQRMTDVAIYPTSGSTYDPSNGAFRGTNQVSWPMPVTHHLAVYIKFLTGGQVAVYSYVDNINVAQTTQPWTYDSTLFQPVIYLQANQFASDSVQVTNWRARKLLPILNKAGRFNPQTIDNLTYQPNNEEQLQFMQLIALKDNAEYREIYHAWPGRDDIELDAVGNLGANQSALLGYSQPGSAPAIASPEVSPFPVTTDFAAFSVTPPFRFEEGWNLEEPPKLLTPSNLHANDILQVGASTAESQVFFEAWSPAETGRPQHSPTGAAYPVFEQVVNDDRVGIQSLIKTLAGYELTRRTDTTPSVGLKVVEERPFAGKWRAGDTVYVMTRSLRNNVEQNLRVFERRWTAGSPVKEVIMGRGEFDTTMMRLYREALTQSWLYDQSGTSPVIYTIANASTSLTTTTATGDIPIPLDQYTTGSQLVYAALHWFADANVMNLQPFINGQGVYVTGLTGASNTDSGLVLVTQYFQAAGTYKIHFLNNDANTRQLQSAFLVLRIKA